MQMRFLCHQIQLLRPEVGLSLHIVFGFLAEVNCGTLLPQLTFSALCFFSRFFRPLISNYLNWEIAIKKENKESACTCIVHGREALY